jgi:hypothetical protein
MSKLNKREIIILVVMACAVLGGVYIKFFTGSAGKNVSVIQTDINTNVSSNIKSDIINNASSPVNAYIITRAEANWGKNPFLEKESYKEYIASTGAASQNNAAVKFIYTGYVDAGKLKMAIINGQEYGRGEKLETEGYFLKEIRFSNVVISNRNTGIDMEIAIQE